ncbi:MAG: signal peptidase I [Candidatus Doudnabacteria bacterium]|nr:signal peptidase I [Candidatus Doudnabacteria bacterium]
MENDQNKNENNKDSDSSLKSVGAFIWDLIKILIIALVIIVPFRMFIAEPFVVSGSSMQPNFHNHDYLIIDRLSYLRSQPQRGDVIVLKFPKDTSQFFIKRIIGLPGETVKVGQGFVTIYNTEHPEGMRITESYLPNQSETFGKTDPVVLGSDEYFVLGDNRTASSDSRVWGILPKDDIVGKVWARVYPPSSAGFFQTPSY